MSHSKLPWTYIRKEFVLPAERYYGTLKFPERKRTHHKIVRLGKTGKLLEVILEYECETGTPLDKKLEDNYHLITQAVNRFGKELEKY